MKWASWSPRGKWALLGIAVSAAVMGMGTDEDAIGASKGHAQLQPAALALAHARDALKSADAGERAEFERMVKQQRQPGDDKEIGNVFNATSWYVPPPQPPQPITPPQPVAPPLPFTYLGQYKGADPASKIIILAGAERIYTVSEGDVIDGIYSVGAMKSGQLELTYLPLNIKQSLNTGGVL